MKSRIGSALLKLVVVCVIVFPQASYAATSKITITAEQWSRVSSTRDFLSIDGLRGLIQQFNEFPSSILVVQYRGGESGQFKAQQFLNRLVAAGIEKSRVQLAQGVPDNAVLVVGLQEDK